MANCMFLRRRLKREPITETKTFIPTSWGNTRGAVTNGNNALANTTNTSYAKFTTGGSTQWCYFHLYFDLSSIPSNATIDSITFKIKASKASSSLENAEVRGWSESPNKIYLASKDLTTSQTTYTWTDTRYTLADLLTFHGTAEMYTDSSSASIRIYGAELTVTYTY